MYNVNDVKCCVCFHFVKSEFSWLVVGTTRTTCSFVEVRQTGEVSLWKHFEISWFLSEINASANEINKIDAK